MNLAQVSRLLAGFTLFFSVALVIPLAVAWTQGRVTMDLGPDQQRLVDPLFGFQVALGVGLGCSVLLWFAGRNARREFFRREGLLVVGLAWLVAGALGATPFLFSHVLESRADALFESVSGLTTTGATVFGSANNAPIEQLPSSILLWRSILQWMGGMGIILVFVVLLPGMGVTGKNLLSSEQIGFKDDSLRPRMQKQARGLFLLYVVLTLAAMGSYWLAGMGGFDAVCHAFTTLASGGFSTRNHSIGAYQSLGIELVAISFMFLAGTNFVLLLSAVRGGFKKPLTLLDNAEFRVYAALLILITLAMTLSLWLSHGTIQDFEGPRDYGNLGRCLRDAAFQTTSILTSTGYCSANYETWLRPCLVLLVFCMLVGGCTGSTAGGLKVMRFLACCKHVTHTVRTFINPKRVEKVRVGRVVVPEHVVGTITALVLMWLAAVAIGTAMLALDARLDLLSAFSASLSMVSCIGPAMTTVQEIRDGVYQPVGTIDLGPYGGYGDLYPAHKLVMSLTMILGRLEILAPLVLLTPGFWRR